jgi:SdpC family antimicrobial peptide
MRSRIRALPILALLVAGLNGCVEVLEPGARLQGPLDGETIFRGLVFGEAPVAGIFPEIWGQVSPVDIQWTAEQHQAVEAAKTELVARMETADPSFFARFHAALTSGRHVRIARALDESAVLFTAAVGSRASHPSDAGRTGMELNYICLILFCEAAVNRAATSSPAIWLSAAIFWEVEHDQGGSSSTIASGSRLRRDEVVQMIATRLKGP